MYFHKIIYRTHNLLRYGTEITSDSSSNDTFLGEQGVQ